MHAPRIRSGRRGGLIKDLWPIAVIFIVGWTIIIAITMGHGA